MIISLMLPLGISLLPIIIAAVVVVDFSGVVSVRYVAIEIGVAIIVAPPLLSSTST